MNPVLVIQNDACEGAGQLSKLFAERELDEHCVLGFDTDYSKLQPNEFSGLVVLGGAQSAYETERYPHLSQEIEICRAFIRDRKPIAGFCLGAQLLARALGGTVLPGRRKEIGWHDLILRSAAKDDSLMRDHPGKLLSYHFHGDIIESVPGATNLAYSALTECQLFRFGTNVYGFQYHAEADLPLIEIMCRQNISYLSSNGFDAEKIISDSLNSSPIFERHSRQVLNRWLDLLSKRSLQT